MGVKAHIRAKLLFGYGCLKGDAGEKRLESALVWKIQNDALHPPVNLHPPVAVGGVEQNGACVHPDDGCDVGQVLGQRGFAFAGVLKGGIVEALVV